LVWFFLPLNGGTFSCYELLTRWLVPLHFDLTEQDRAYANAFVQSGFWEALFASFRRPPHRITH